MIANYVLIKAVATLIFLGVATVFDIKTFKVPNWLSYSGIVAGLACTLIFETELLISALITAAIFLALFAFHVTGGGDAKCLMAVGAAWGIKTALLTFVLACAAFIVYHVLKRPNFVRESVVNIVRRFASEPMDLTIEKKPFLGFILFGFLVVISVTFLLQGVIPFV